MSQRHVNLLMEAVNIPESESEFLCDRIRFITGFFRCASYDEYRNKTYTIKHGDALVRVIQDWLDDNGGYDDNLDSWVGYSFEITPLYEVGCTREQWAKEILAPLALALEEN